MSVGMVRRSVTSPEDGGTVKSSKGGRDVDWFPWDEEPEDSRPAPTTGPWPASAVVPRPVSVADPRPVSVADRAVAGDGGAPVTVETAVPGPAAPAALGEDAKDIDAFEFRSYGAPSPAPDTRGGEPLTASAQDAEDTDEIEFRSYGAPSPAPDTRGEEPLTAGAQDAKDTDEIERSAHKALAGGGVVPANGGARPLARRVAGGAVARFAGTQEPDRAAPIVMETLTDVPAASRRLQNPSHLWPPGHQQPPAGPPGPPHAGKQRSDGPSRKMMAALAAAGVAVLAAGGITLAFARAGNSTNASCSGKPCATSRHQATAAAPPAGPRLRYRTVDRETGYFEGIITIVNAGDRPMNSWTLSFTYPGADIHNVWEAVFRRKGETVTIVNAMTAAPIAPGKKFDVQFGGAGHPTMPTGCRLNDAPCVFVR
jgi:hypothetical protein